MQPIPAYATHATLFSPSPPYMSLAAQSERSCTLNVKSVSGSTAGRRNILSNSRTKGAPVIVKGPSVIGKGLPVTIFETMVISCTFVGSCRMRILALLLGVLRGSSLLLGACSHFSIRSLDCAFCARRIEMIIIFTSPPDSVSHQLASNLRRRSDSDTPDSMTIVARVLNKPRRFGQDQDRPRQAAKILIRSYLISLGGYQTVRHPVRGLNP
jgi:hypothetical protein